jgi:conjugative transfer region lipoprotein (TIGR03751 family)
VQNINAISISLILLLTGCTGQRVVESMRTDGVESRELYQRHSQSQVTARGPDRLRQALRPVKASAYRGYTRDAMNEQTQLFSVLPNPKIAIYVFPHLATRDNAPVPGYTTSVTLYPRDEYALPEDAVETRL